MGRKSLITELRGVAGNTDGRFEKPNPSIVDDGNADEGPRYPPAQFGDKNDVVASSTRNDRPRPDPIISVLLEEETTTLGRSRFVANVEDGRGEGNGVRKGEVGTLGKLASLSAIFDLFVDELLL